MKSISQVFTYACPGLPLTAVNGDTVNAMVPSGCCLVASTDMENWYTVSDHVFVHTGGGTAYRIDCVEYSTPVTSTLTVLSA